MNIDQWISAWGADRLIRPQAIRGLPIAASEFIRSYGMPGRVIFEGGEVATSGGITFEVSFAALSHPLRRYSQLISGSPNPELDRSWSEQLVIAEEDFCNGSASYCVQRVRGTVTRIDVELPKPEKFVNSTVEQFAHALLLATQWSAANRQQDPQVWKRSLAALAGALQYLDANSFGDRRMFWPSLIEWITDAGPDSLDITSDPMRSKPRF